MLLITGGVGFIGSCLAREVQSRGIDDFVLVDWLGSHDKWQNIAGLSPFAIIEPESLFSFLETSGDMITKVVHLGAISSTVETDADLIYQTNVALPHALMQWCTENTVPFIYASSAATYGRGDVVACDIPGIDVKPVHPEVANDAAALDGAMDGAMDSADTRLGSAEDITAVVRADDARGFDDEEALSFLQALRPLNAYGWSKNLFDINVMQMKETAMPLPPQWVGLKFFNVYGPCEAHKQGQASVAYHLFNQIQKTGQANLFMSHHAAYGNGEQTRDFVYVKDCVQVILWLLDHPDVSGLFNVGTGTARTFNDLARAVFKSMNKDKKIGYIPTPVNIRDKYQYHTQAAMSKLRRAGYVQPFYSLEAGVHDYITGHLLASPQTAPHTDFEGA